MGLTAPTSLTTGVSTSTATPATGSVSPAANSLVIVTMYAHTSGGTNFTDTATCAGHASTTWTKRGAALSADGKQYLVQFTAQQASYTASAITVTLNTSATEVRWQVTQYNPALITVPTSGAYVQSGAAAVAASTAPSFTPGAMGGPGNSLFVAWGHKAAEATSPGSGFSELTDQTGTAISLETQYSGTKDVTGNASWATSAVSIYAYVEVDNREAFTSGADTVANGEDDVGDSTVTPGNSSSGHNEAGSWVRNYLDPIADLTAGAYLQTDVEDGDDAPGGGPTGTWAGVT